VITSSRLEIARLCPGAFALDHVDESTPEAEAGTARHSQREAEINSGNVPAVLTERWPDLEWRAEVAFAYDVATGLGRELGQNIGRGYATAGATPFEVCGTADVVGYGRGKLVILDWKSFDPNVSRPGQNAQLHILALAASRAYGLTAAQVAIHHEIRGLDVAALDELDLDAFASEVRDITASVAKARQDHRAGTPVQFTTGQHCRYCPAFHACPKQKALVLELASGAADKRVEMIVPLADDESAADAYEFSRQIGLLKKRLDAALYARAQERPIPLRSGKMFGPVEKLSNEKLDGDIVYQVVKAKHGQVIADTAVERHATKTKLREALGFVDAKSVAAAEREILEAVRAAGGATREKKTEIAEYAPQLVAAEGK
jgi:hypothetical protein